MSAPLVHSVDLSKHYRSGNTIVRALSDVSLSIGEGEFVAIVGRSGSGKSTLMHLLGLLERPDHGQYALKGDEVAGLSEEARAAIRNRRIGFVFQLPALLPRASALENVALPLVYAGVRAAERHRRAKEALEVVGLGKRLSHRPNQLSGGEQQRVSIARAIVNNPDLILADEPTGALDSSTSDEIIGIFDELNHSGRTIVIVTHAADVAERARRRIRLHDGRILEDETASLQSARQTSVVRSRAARMSLAESFRAGMRALGVHKLRSALTALGIVIGVAAVVCMVAVAAGAQTEVGEQIRSLGANLLLVLPGAQTSKGARLEAGTRHTLTEDDATAIERQIPGAQVVAPLLSRPLQIVAGDKNWATTVAGINADYLVAREWAIARGRPFTTDELQSGAKVAIIGSAIVEQLFESGGPGETLRIGNVPFSVIGVLDKKGQGATGRSQDDIVFIPLSTAQGRVLGAVHGSMRSALDYILIKAADAEAFPELKSGITALLRQRHQLRMDAPDDFAIENPADVLMARQWAQRALGILLISIALVSLLVGGISIMNIMLVSVSERTREIGLRMAVGARRRDIRRQFLIEAATLTSSVGLAGALSGSAAAVAIAWQAGWPVVLSPWAIVLACFFAGLVGIAFGLYPAVRAAHLDPIIALRCD